MIRRCITILLLCISYNTCAFKLTRVILATNDNPEYIQFWPQAARAWKEIVGIQPTLALIADESVQVDETVGDVIRFKPLKGIPTAFYAQCVRLLLPGLFPDDICVVADIDLFPLQEKFFTRYLKFIEDDCFVTYRDKEYWWFKPRIYMCYNAAKGSTFGEIFGARVYDNIPEIIKRWHQLGIGWATDERLLYQHIKAWTSIDGNKRRWKKLGLTATTPKRISRRDQPLKFSEKKLRKGYYIELNCPRPYEKHKKEIDHIVNLAVLAAAKKKASIKWG